MKPTKLIGILLLVFAVYTVLGMILKNESFWTVYNYVTLVFSIASGVVLVKKG